MFFAASKSNFTVRTQLRSVLKKKKKKTEPAPGRQARPFRFFSSPAGSREPCAAVGRGPGTAAPRFCGVVSGRCHALSWPRCQTPAGVGDIANALPLPASCRGSGKHGPASFRPPELPSDASFTALFGYVQKKGMRCSKMSTTLHSAFTQLADINVLLYFIVVPPSRPSNSVGWCIKLKHHSAVGKLVYPTTIDSTGVFPASRKLLGFHTEVLHFPS
jgi:hypothetical protein